MEKANQYKQVVSYFSRIGQCLNQHRVFEIRKQVKVNCSWIIIHTKWCKFLRLGNDPSQNQISCYNKSDIILRISDEYLVRIRRNWTSNVTVRLKTRKLGFKTKIYLISRALYISENANPKVSSPKVSILQFETPPVMILQKTKFSISKQFINA